MSKKYHEIAYNGYTCSTCGTKHFMNVCPRADFYSSPDVYDIDGGVHCHDTSSGDVHLICINNHVTIKPIVHACECGWTSIGGDSTVKIIHSFPQKSSKGKIIVGRPL
jgi:hypothetical protein